MQEANDQAKAIETKANASEKKSTATTTENAWLKYELLMQKEGQIL